MTKLPKDTWRLADPLTLREAAFLAAGFDPNVHDLSSNERDDVNTYLAALGRAAIAAKGNKQVQLEIVEDGIVGPYAEDQKTQVAVDWVRDFLSSKGVTAGFFFPEADKAPDAFRDPNHDHYSAELHIAVMAWEALESERILARGPKPAISDWLDEHAKDWLAEKPLGTKAKERIVTMVNWRKEGGANKTP